MESTLKLNCNWLRDQQAAEIVENINKSLRPVELTIGAPNHFLVEDEETTRALITILNNPSTKEKLKSLVVKYVRPLNDAFESLGLVLRDNTTLETLELKACMYRNDPPDSMFDALESNTTLKKLIFESCMLSQPQIDKLGTMLRNPETKLETLVLNNIFLNNMDITSIAEALVHNQTLKTFGFYRSIENGLKKLASALSVNQTLQVLHFSLYRVPNSSALGNDVIRNAKWVHEIKFAENLFEPGMAAFGYALANHTRLKTLIVDESHFVSASPSDFKPFMDGLRTSRSLEELRLPNCSASSPDFFPALAKAVGSNTSLKSLVLDGCRIHDFKRIDMNDFFDGVRSNRSLVNLSLKYCYLTPLMGRRGGFAEFLSSNSALRRLCLTQNDIGEECIHTIAYALKTNKTTLKYLDLSNCDIDPKNGEILATMVRTNRTLKRLNLDGNNDLNNDTAVAFANALMHNTTLEDLRLSSTSINDGGVVPIAKVLFGSNRTLKRLSLWTYGIGAPADTELREAIRANTTLDQILLNGDDSEYEDEFALRNMRLAGTTAAAARRPYLSQRPLDRIAQFALPPHKYDEWHRRKDEEEEEETNVGGCLIF